MQFASWNTVSLIAKHRYQISLCPQILELCALDIIFPVETTRNYGLHGYCGKITNCRLLRMKLSHMSSRALIWSPGTHTSFAVINTYTHRRKKIVFTNNSYKTDMLIDTVAATLPNTNSQKHAQSCAHAVPHLQSWEGHPSALRERLCGCSHVYVWEISNDERMPFQVWARGASVQCPTLSYAHTHALPLTHECVHT